MVYVNRQHIKIQSSVRNTTCTISKSKDNITLWRDTCTPSLVDPFIPDFLIVKAICFDHYFQGLILSFQGTLGLWTISWSNDMSNVQQLHYLLQFSKCEIGTLVRLNIFGHTKLCSKFVKTLIMCWEDIFLKDITSGNLMEAHMTWLSNWSNCFQISGYREQPPRGTPWVSGLVRHFVQTWPDSECSHTVQFLDSAVLRL